MKEITQLLKIYRPEELAKRIGVSRATIFNWKSGEVDPTPLAKEKIKAVLTEELAKK